MEKFAENPDPQGVDEASLEREIEAQVYTWREKRGDGWSETLYKGIATEIHGVPVFITKLSHGLRVVPRKPDTEYSFQGEARPVKISQKFLNKAEKAFSADLEFQEYTGEYDEYMN